MARKHNFKDISFNLTDDDQIKFNDYYIHNSSAGKRTLMTQKLMVPVLTVCFFVFMKMAHMNGKILYGGTILLALLSVVMWRKAEETVQQQQMRSLEGPGSNQGSREYKMLFGDEEVAITFNGSEKSIPYSKILKISMSDEYLYIWMDKRMVFPVPKRAFTREGDMEELYSFLVGHLQNK